MKSISFTTNWNNKLNCSAFSTIRISNEVYKVGEHYEVKIKKRVQGQFRIVEKKTFLLKNISEGMAWIDTGYGRTQTIDIIKRIHNSRNYNWDTQKLDWIILVRDEKK